MSRAGCSAGMFSASKQCHSSSDLRPFDDREAHACEDVFETIAHDGQRMAMAQAAAPVRAA